MGSEFNKKNGPNIWKADFPIFSSSNLCYLDSASSAQKPTSVIEAERKFYSSGYANIHRGIYSLSTSATQAYEEVRSKVAKFIGANSEQEIVFTHGTTESINLISYALESKLVPGDEIIISLLEHHANFVPWQMLAKRRGLKLIFWEPEKCLTLSTERLKRLLSPRTKLLAITQLSNSIGYAPQLAEIVPLARDAGGMVLIDGAQGVCHFPTDVSALGADFYAFSGHKLYGPTGVGVIWGKLEVMNALDPFLTGGDMIRRVSVDGTTFCDMPQRFEAGTPNIAGVIGLGAAIDYIQSCGLEKIAKHENALIKALQLALADVKNVTVLGASNDLHGLVSFLVDSVHPHDVAQYLNELGIAVRAGHHCAQPLMQFAGIQSSSRASIGLYNTLEDIERLAEGLHKLIGFFSRK